MAKYKRFAWKSLYPITRGYYACAYTSWDIVANIFLKLLSGIYHWNCEKCSFDSFMFYRIKTEVQNITKHERRFYPVPLDNLLSDPAGDFRTDEMDMDLRITKELIIQNDSVCSDEEDGPKVCLLEFKEIVNSLFSNSPVEFCVLDELFKNRKPKEIAVKLGIPRREVRNTAMRIRRTLIKWCRKNNHQALLKELTRPAKRNKRHANRQGIKTNEVSE